MFYTLAFHLLSSYCGHIAYKFSDTHWCLGEEFHVFTLLIFNDARCAF